MNTVLRFTLPCLATSWCVVGMADDLSEPVASAVPEGFSGQVVLATHDEVLYSGSFGLANREAGTLVTNDMLFDIGSIAKTFTATAILDLAAGVYSPEF